MIRSECNLTSQYAVLAALEGALVLFTSLWGQHIYRDINKLRIYSDCKSALQVLQSPQGQSGQSVFKRIVEKLERIQV